MMEIFADLKTLQEYVWKFFIFELRPSKVVGEVSGPVQSGRSWVKVDGPEIQKWTVQKEMTLWSEVLNLDGLKG